MAESMKDYEKEIAESTRVIEIGDIITGTIIGISDDEVTLDLNYYTQGIIKRENLSNDPKFNPIEELSYGRKMEAAVVSLDDGNGNIELSKKEANDTLAWEHFAEMLENKTQVSVRVREAVKGGLVAYLEGIRGFIPASHVSTSFVEDLTPYVGQELTVIVITADKEKKRLVFSAREVLRQIAREEKDHKIASLAPGEVVEGVVETLQPYGVFVNIGDGISGLVHISQLSMKRVESPKEVVKEGQKVRVKILNTNNGKVSLSMRAVEMDERPAKIAAEEKKQKEEIEQFADHETTGTSLGDLLKGLKL